MQDYNDVPEDYADDNIDNAAEPETGDVRQAPKDAVQAEEKITTKFLTKYERGKLNMNGSSRTVLADMFPFRINRNTILTCPSPWTLVLSSHSRYTSFAAEHGSPTNG